MQPIIEVSDVRKRYGAVEVLKGIDLTIQKGEIVAIVGSSGAGKTTLLQMMGTLDTPTSGKIRMYGRNIAKLKGKALSEFRNRHIGFVFQFHNLLPEFSAVENICIPSWISGMSRKEGERKALELMDFLGISHRKDNKPSQLSGGEQQRVAVARSLINSPGVVFADEPTGNLDSANARELHDLLFKLRENFNQTFVIVTHNEELAQSTDRILHIRDGILEKNSQ